MKAPAGKTVAVTRLKGPRAITGIRVKLDLPPAPADYDALRELAVADQMGRRDGAERLGAAWAISLALPRA